MTQLEAQAAEGAEVSRMSPNRPMRTVVCGFMVLAASNAGGFYGLAVYLGSLEASGRFSLDLVSALTSVFFLVSGVAGLVVGRSLALVGVRRMVLAGAVAAGLGVWLVGHAHDPWQLVCAYILLGISMSLAGPIPLTTALIETVRHAGRRNQAMAVMLSGMTAGGAAFVPLLARAVEGQGLAATTSVAAPLIALGVGVPALFLMSSGGLSPVPAGETVDLGADRSGAAVWGTPRAMRLFLLLCLLFVSFLGAQVGFNSQLYKVGTDLGITTAGGALGVVAAVGMLARLVGIAAVRLVRPEYFLAGMAIAQSLAAVAVLLRPDELGLYISAALLGMAVGNASVLSPVLVLQLFGSDVYARLLARMSFLMTLGIASGPALAGAIRSRTGSYEVVLVAVAVLSFAAAALCMVLAYVSRPTSARP